MKTKEVRFRLKRLSGDSHISVYKKELMYKINKKKEDVTVGGVKYKNKTTGRCKVKMYKDSTCSFKTVHLKNKDNLISTGILRRIYNGKDEYKLMNGQVYIAGKQISNTKNGKLEFKTLAYLEESSSGSSSESDEEEEMSSEEEETEDDKSENSSNNDNAKRDNSNSVSKDEMIIEQQQVKKRNVNPEDNGNNGKQNKTNQQKQQRFMGSTARASTSAYNFTDRQEEEYSTDNNQLKKLQRKLQH